MCFCVYLPFFLSNHPSLSPPLFLSFYLPVFLFLSLYTHFPFNTSFPHHELNNESLIFQFISSMPVFLFTCLFGNQRIDSHLPFSLHFSFLSAFYKFNVYSSDTLSSLNQLFWRISRISIDEAVKSLVLVRDSRFKMRSRKPSFRISKYVRVRHSTTQRRSRTAFRIHNSLKTLQISKCVRVRRSTIQRRSRTVLDSK